MKTFLILLFLSLQLHSGQIIVNKKNSISHLSATDVHQIFHLKQLAWSNGETISVYMLPSVSPTQNDFTKRYLQMNAREVYEYWMAYVLNGGMNNPPLFLNERRLLKQIDKKVNSIGLVSDNAVLPSNVKVIHTFGRIK